MEIIPAILENGEPLTNLKISLGEFQVIASNQGGELKLEEVVLGLQGSVLLVAVMEDSVKNSDSAGVLGHVEANANQVGHANGLHPVYKMSWLVCCILDAEIRSYIPKRNRTRV